MRHEHQARNQEGLARELLALGGHWGRLKRLRQARRERLAGSRHGVDLIDLCQSARDLGELARALSAFGPREVALVARERRAVEAVLGLEESLAAWGLGRVALGRWAGGRLTNIEAGAWGRDRPKFLLAVGPGVEIALREARKLGIACAWVGDTDSREKLADGFCALNASSTKALSKALHWAMDEAWGARPS